MFELHGETYPDFSAIKKLPIMVRAEELRLQKYGPVIPLHECPGWSRWTTASSEFEFCFKREPEAGDLLRWQHVPAMRGPELNEIKFRFQIEAWDRQLPELPCPLRFENGRLFKRKRNGEWFEEFSVAWQIHWLGVENGAGIYPPCDVDKMLTYPGNDAHQRAVMSVLGVTFVGLIDGKHSCRPATNEELAQPEADEFFRELLCSEPTAAAPRGFVWLRHHGSGIYEAVPAEDASRLLEQPSPEYSQHHCDQS